MTEQPSSNNPIIEGLIGEVFNSENIVIESYSAAIISNPLERNSCSPVANHISFKMIQYISDAQ